GPRSLRRDRRRDRSSELPAYVLASLARADRGQALASKGSVPHLLPGADGPECVARTGRRVQISALVGASVPAGDRFQALVEEKAAVFGFTARVAWGYAARN